MPLNATEPFVSIPAEGVEIYTAASSKPA